MSENFLSKFPDEVKKELEILDSGRFFALNSLITDFVKVVGGVLYEIGTFERDVPNFVQFSNELSQEELTLLLSGLINQQTLGFELLQGMLKINTLMPQISEYWELSSDEKIALGESIIQIAEEMREGLNKMRGSSR